MSETTTTIIPAPTPNLNKALSQLQGELPRVTKTKEGRVEGESKNSGKAFSYTYKYADLADVVAETGPLLAKFGLAFHSAPTIDPANRSMMILAWSLLHESGEEKTGEWPLGPVNQKPQTLGSMITYGRRYSFSAAINIVVEDDDDGQRAQQDHGSRQSAGDVFDNAAPRPMNQGPRPEPQASAAPEDDPWYGKSWLDAALDQAATFTDPEVGRRLWREAAAKGRSGEVGTDGVKEVQDLITARMEDLAARRQAAMDPAERALAEVDAAFAAALSRIGNGDWEDKVRSISDEGEARAVIAEADSSKILAVSKRHHIRDAVLIRWPGAADAAGDEAA